MRRAFIFVFIFFNILSARASDCTDFLSQIYSENYHKNVKIISKREFCDKCEQKLGNEVVSSIVYGLADMKIKGQRKQKVTYICLIGNDCQPIWGYVIPN